MKNDREDSDARKLIEIVPWALSAGKRITPNELFFPLGGRSPGDQSGDSTDREEIDPDDEILPG